MPSFHSLQMPSHDQLRLLSGQYVAWKLLNIFSSSPHSSPSVNDVSAREAFVNALRAPSLWFQRHIYSFRPHFDILKNSPSNLGFSLWLSEISTGMASWQLVCVVLHELYSLDRALAVRGTGMKTKSKVSSFLGSVMLAEEQKVWSRQFLTQCLTINPAVAAYPLYVEEAARTLGTSMLKQINNQR